MTTTVDTHVVDWAADLAGDLGIPDTHGTRSALAAWALATSRDDVADMLAPLFAVAGEDDEPIVLTEDQQRIRTSLATGADADVIARNVANAGGPDFRDFVRHVIDGDHSAFDPDDIAAATRADEIAVTQRQAAEDAAPATRGDMRELTDAIGALVAELRGARTSSSKPAPAKKAAPRKATAKKTTAPKAPDAPAPAATPPAGQTPASD